MLRIHNQLSQMYTLPRIPKLSFLSNIIRCHTSLFRTTTFRRNKTLVPPDAMTTGILSWGHIHLQMCSGEEILQVQRHTLLTRDNAIRRPLCQLYPQNSYIAIHLDL